LASGSASAASVDVPETVSLPATPEPAVAPSPPSSAPSPAAVEPTEPAAPETNVPLPGSTPAPAPEPSEIVPLPSPTVALPDVEEDELEPSSVNVENEREVARATQDAFAGAFSSQLEPEPVQVEPTETVAAPEPVEEEFVSAAEHFIAADEDGSGALDVEELAQATGTTLEEAAQLHAEADTDGDGVVTLSEFIASPAAEKTASLPKPVAPVRRPLGQINQPTAAQPNPVTQRPQPLPTQPQAPMGQQPPAAQGWQQPPPMQGWQQPPVQGWQQPQRPLVQPTIRSGIHCRGCGIGLDPYWRFCPVCGQQNLGY
jgi:hypothetical protein